MSELTTSEHTQCGRCFVPVLACVEQGDTAVRVSSLRVQGVGVIRPDHKETSSLQSCAVQPPLLSLSLWEQWTGLTSRSQSLQWASDLQMHGRKRPFLFTYELLFGTMEVSHNTSELNLRRCFHWGYNQSYFSGESPEKIANTLPRLVYPTSFSSFSSQNAARYDEPNPVISWVAFTSFLFVKWWILRSSRHRTGTFSDSRTCKMTDG